MNSYIVLFVLLIIGNYSFSQSILYEKDQNGFAFFGSYSGDISTNTFGLGGSYTYHGKFDFGYSYGYTTPKPASEALYAIGNRLNFSYLFRKKGNLGDYAIEPGIDFSWGKDQETNYRVFSGGLSLHKPISINEISGIIPEFSLGGRIIMDTQYRYVMTFGGNILFYIRSSRINSTLAYIKVGLVLTNYGSLFFVKLGFALDTKK